MRRMAVVAVGILALAGLTACWGSSHADSTELCQDLTNLQSTVAFLEAPPRDATVGDVRGSLDKLDGTWQAVHDDAAVPEDEGEALLQSQQAYREAIEGIGDDDAFAPYVPSTRGIAEGLMRSYLAVRVRLVCPPSLQPG